MPNEQTDQRQQMAALLRSKIDTILENWEAAVRAHVSGDQNLSKSLLRNSLHLLLENLADALADARWNYHVAKNVEIALEHGHQRYRIDGHEFDQVIDEYAELRKVIIRNVASDSHSTSQGVEVIHAFIDASIKHASGLFAALHHRDDKKALVDKLDETRGQRDDYAGERDSIRGHAKALEQERSLRSDVISMLGHDMRTPVTAALLTAEMLAKNPENVAKKPQKIGRIIQGLQRLDAMIQNLLDADRLRTDQPYPIRVTFCDVAEIVDKARNELTTVHGGRFLADVPYSVAGYWDCGALQRVLENLANNAVKYGSPASFILLQLKKEGEHIELRVHNDGDPIVEEDLPNLFEPHFRTDKAQRSAKPGWGLGLALVKAVAVAHGGSVSVDSLQNSGTTFCVRLPVDCRESQTEAKA